MVGAIFLFTFLAVSLLAWVALRPRDNAVRQRMTAGGPSTYALGARELEGGLTQRVLAPAVFSVGRFLQRLLPQNAIRSIEKTLVMANEPLSLPVFLTLWAGLAALGMLLLAHIWANRPMTPLQFGIIAVVLMFVVTLLPYYAVVRRVRSRQKRIRKALPYALDLLVTAVEAGLGMDSAFSLVAEKTNGPISEALSLYLKQIGLGQARRDALKHVAERTGVRELVRLAGSIAQAEITGSTLGDVLRAQAEDMRMEQSQRAQEAGQKAPALMTIPLVLCFLPAMVVVVVIPSVLNLLSFLGGMAK